MVDIHLQDQNPNRNRNPNLTTRRMSFRTIKKWNQNLKSGLSQNHDLKCECYDRKIKFITHK